MPIPSNEGILGLGDLLGDTGWEIIALVLQRRTACLVYLVCLVHLVSLVHLVYLVCLVA
jgi:hypothetical protein